MDKELYDFVEERAKVLAEAGSSKAETKAAASDWLAAVQADSSEEAVDKATEALLEYLEGKPRTIDGIIGFAEGPAKDVFGEEAAAAMLEKHKARKEQGERYCDCPSCTAASELLIRFGRA